MRTFKIGHGEDRKFVILEVEGSRLTVTKGNANGTTKRIGKDFSDEFDAHSRSDEMARDLSARGYVEANTRSLVTPRTPSLSRKSATPNGSGGLDLGLLAEAGEADGEKVESLLPARAPAAEVAPKKAASKKKRKKKAKGAAGSGDALDRRVIAGIGGSGLLVVAVAGYLFYSAFLKPPTIVGHWEGSRTEHEIGKFLTHTQYVLVLDDRKNASMSVQGGPASGGTYALQGDRLTLTIKDEEGEVSEFRYKVDLGGSTLDLYDEQSGKKVVQLLRFQQKSPRGRPSAPPAPPAEVVGGPANKAADDRLASVPFAVKDAAFGLRHPPGWEVETGARPDNSYSWARFTKGSAKIQVFADVAGSLLAGPNSADQEEGSPYAPVHGAHERYKKQAAELYADYQESEPAPFKGSALGEGRIATFTASGGGLFGSKLRGIRVTLLTNDRRISILCEAPSKEFEALKATFLATCRSLSR